MGSINVNVSSANLSASINSVNVDTIFINTKYPHGNFSQALDCKVKNDYFRWNTSAYNNEKKMYEKVMNGAFNSHGIKGMFYTSDYNITYDMIFGEDRDRTIVRNFPIMFWADLPPQDRLFGQFGIDAIDTFHLYISKSHFNAASKLLYTGNPLQPTYSSVVPKAGDLIKFEYNNVFYEIIYVGEQEEMFLQAKHSWDCVVRVFRDSKTNLNPSTSATMGELINVINKDDVLKINDTVDTKKTDILYQPGLNEKPVRDPFAGW